MIEPIIRNHQYNFIKNQIVHLQQACRTVSDSRVVEAVRYGAESNVKELLADAPDTGHKLTKAIPALQQAEDFQQYLQSLEPYRKEFPRVTENQLRKLFPKSKKLALPDLSVDFRAVTYLGWIDLSANKLFIVYPLDGQLVGTEGKITPTQKKSTCFLCGKHGETALFTAISKSRPAHASPDYYKAVGNYLCMGSHECNKSITDVSSLERFLREVTR